MAACCSSSLLSYDRMECCGKETGAGEGGCVGQFSKLVSFTVGARLSCLFVAMGQEPGPGGGLGQEIGVGIAIGKGGALGCCGQGSSNATGGLGSGCVFFPV